ncbi:MAG: hypothetical protein IKO75_05050 [Bacteroidales bacterium]|nr:hypothetical protein [Bacteroidales bacterium]
MIIIAEHKVLGSTVNDRADGILSVTNKVSERGAILMSDFFASEDYASMLFFLYPSTGLYTIMHYQAKFTAFPEHNRWYDERALYELSPSEFEKIQYSYSTLLPSLDKFKEYTSRYYGASNEVEVPLTTPIVSMSGDVQLLKNAIIQGVLGNKKVFVKLGDGDKVKGDAVRNATKLKTILAAVSQLPEFWRRYVSVAYGVENKSRVYDQIATEIVVFAIFDDVSDWGEWAADAITVDWRTDTICGKFGAVDEREMAVFDRLMSVYNTDRVLSTRDFSTLVGTVGKKIDDFPCLTVDKAKSLSTTDVVAIERWFNAGNHSYLHKDVSLRMLWLSVLGMTKTFSKAVFKEYPDLRNDNTYITLLKDNVNKSGSFQQLSDIYDNNKDISEIRKVIEGKVLADSRLVDACADNPRSDLSKNLQDKIKDSAKKWTEDEKIARLDNPYFGLSLEKSFVVKNWADFNRLFGKMNNRRDIIKLPFNVNWVDRIPPELFKKIQKRFTEDDCKILYDKVAPLRATLNDYADIACRYGRRFFPSIKDDIDNASRPVDSRKFEEDLSSLLNSFESKEIGVLLSEKYFSLKMNDLSGLIATLKDGCSDFVLNAITGDRINQIIKSDDRTSGNQIVVYLQDLYNIKEKRVVDKRDKVLNGMAVRYIREELLSETSLDKMSFWKLLDKPQTCVSKWFELIANRIFELGDEDKKKLCSKYIDYYTHLNTAEKSKNISREAKLFLKHSTKNLMALLKNTGRENEADCLKSSMPKSLFNRLVQTIKGWGRKWIMFCIVALAVIVGIAISLVILMRGCDKSLPTPLDPQPPALPIDTLYYKMLINDTVSDSLGWNCVPLDSIHPILLFANKYLDSLYQHDVSAFVEMKVSNVDSTFCLHISSDSIWFISRLRPLVEYYSFALDNLHKSSADTISLRLKCIDSKHPRDTINVSVSSTNPLMMQILANDTLQGCNVVSCNGRVIDNTDFERKNGHLRTLGRTDYYLWIIQQLNEIKTYQKK